jgi:hypothetical protein
MLLLDANGDCIPAGIPAQGQAHIDLAQLCAVSPVTQRTILRKIFRTSDDVSLTGTTQIRLAAAMEWH